MARCAAAAAGLCLAACTAGRSANNDAAIAAAARAEIAAHPHYYTNGTLRSALVGRDGAVHGVIWGTFHAGYNDTTIPPKTIRDRLEGAVDLTVEVVTDRRSPEQMRLLLRPCREAASQADPAVLAALDPATRDGLTAAGVPDDVMRSSSLFGLAAYYSARTAPLARTALPSGSSPDDVLTREARVLSIPVHPLERLQDQVTLLCSDPNGPVAAMDLRLRVRRGAGNADLGQFNRHAYETHDIAAVVAASVWLADAADQVPLALQHQTLFGDRNRSMATKVSARLREPGFHFVAVGAGHLIGDDGLVASLERDGWTVTPLPD